MDKKTTFEILTQELEKIPKAQVRSLSLEVLPRLMGAIDNHKNKCPKCNKFTVEGEQYVHNVKTLFNDDVKVLRSFENWVELSQKHLKQEHQLQVKGRLTSSYTAIGMALGILVAVVYVWITSGYSYVGPLVLGCFIGMSVGYVLGKTTENKLHKQKKLY